MTELKDILDWCCVHFKEGDWAIAYEFESNATFTKGYDITIDIVKGWSSQRFTFKNVWDYALFSLTWC